MNLFFNFLCVFVSCRPDHAMGPEGGGQNSMGPSGNEAGMYPANRYPHQR